MEDEVPKVVDILQHHTAAPGEHFVFVGVGLDEEDEQESDGVKLQALDVLLDVL